MIGIRFYFFMDGLIEKDCEIVFFGFYGRGEGGRSEV